MPRGPKRFAA